MPASSDGMAPPFKPATRMLVKTNPMSTSTACCRLKRKSLGRSSLVLSTTKATNKITEPNGTALTMALGTTSKAKKGASAGTSCTMGRANWTPSISGSRYVKVARMRVPVLRSSRSSLRPGVDGGGDGRSAAARAAASCSCASTRARRASARSAPSSSSKRSLASSSKPRAWPSRRPQAVARRSASTSVASRPSTSLSLAGSSLTARP
mmetsp:Transcript_69342/g.224176  ORF Transcript_69342/g.224176 Transcript_69342/m.224176 type:complete len:208 (+) Transcript_69342:516-1139(+)